MPGLTVRGSFFSSHLPSFLFYLFTCTVDCFNRKDFTKLSQAAVRLRYLSNVSLVSNVDSILYIFLSPPCTAHKPASSSYLLIITFCEQFYSPFTLLFSYPSWHSSSLFLSFYFSIFCPRSILFLVSSLSFSLSVLHFFCFSFSSFLQPTSLFYFFFFYINFSLFIPFSFFSTPLSTLISFSLFIFYFPSSFFSLFSIPFTRFFLIRAFFHLSFCLLFSIPSFASHSLVLF